MYRFLAVTILAASLFIQSCSKKSNGDVNNNNNNQGNQNPVETATLKYIPDSMFRVYLKANVCPDAFDKSGKLIDITNSEVKNFTGTMTIDTVTCPYPYVSSLKGVQYFTNMTKLIVSLSPIDSLDLTATNSIDTLRLLNNVDLQYVALSGCTSMRYTRITNTPTTSLDFSNLPQLNYINLILLQRLSQLKTDNDANLQHLMTYGLTSLSTLNVSTNTALRRLFLESCTVINTVDLSHNHKLAFFVAANAGSLKTIDLSPCDSLKGVNLDDTSIDTIDFSHNPQLLSVTMLRTPIRNLSFLSNPNLRLLYLDGCGQLKTADLRAQPSFDCYYIDQSKYLGMGEDDEYQILQDGFFSLVQTPTYPVFMQATRAGVNGATTNLFGGLRFPQYLDGGGLSLSQIKMNDATKDNYSIVMARRTGGLTSIIPVLETVYASATDTTTITCHDYDPTLSTCNQK